MRVLVTGVGGFVGTALARRLAADGHDVVGTYLGGAPTISELDLRPADVLDRPRLDRLLAEVTPDAVFHLAGFSHVGESWQRPHDYFQVNVLGVDHLLAAAGGSRFFLASSAEVYGRVAEAEQPIAEERRVAPRNPYALTKAAAELLVLARGGVVARLFNVIGPGQAADFALPSFACQLAAVAAGGAPVLKVGNLEARRDFLHVDDAVGGFAALLAAEGATGVYNLGRGEAMSIRQALDLLIEIAGVEVEIEEDPERLRPHDVELTLADSRRLRSLGWRPRKPPRQALEDLWTEVTAGT